MGIDATVRLGTPSTRTVAIIGDSLTVGMDEAATRTALQALGYANDKIWFYAVSGKAINIADANGRLTVDDIALARSDLGVEPSCWVLALGTNGYDNSAGSNTTRINLMTSALADAPRVLWPNVAINPTNANETAFNSQLQSMLSSHPQFTYLDWETYFKALPSQGTLWNGDIHYTTAGYTARRNYMVSQIGAPV